MSVDMREVSQPSPFRGNARTDMDRNIDVYDVVQQPSLLEQLTLRDLISVVAVHGLASKYGYYTGLADEATTIADQIMERRK